MSQEAILPEEQQRRMEHYLDRVRKASPLVAAILKKYDLNLGGQFNQESWPKALEPVAVYIDTKDWNAPTPVLEGVSEDTEEEAILSPVQPEDIEEALEAEEEADEETNP